MAKALKIDEANSESSPKLKSFYSSCPSKSSKDRTSPLRLCFRHRPRERPSIWTCRWSHTILSVRKSSSSGHSSRTDLLPLLYLNIYAVFIEYRFECLNICKGTFQNFKLHDKGVAFFRKYVDIRIFLPQFRKVRLLVLNLLFEGKNVASVFLNWFFGFVLAISLRHLIQKI